MTETPNNRADRDAQEVQRRVPQAGLYSPKAFAALSAGAFGSVGYFIGKYLGRMGDDEFYKNTADEFILDANAKKISRAGRKEIVGKWVGAAGFALTALSAAVHTARKASAQAEELAARTVKLEHENAALAAAVGKPVGTLIEADDMAVKQAAPSVSEALHDGVVQKPAPEIAPVL